MASTPASYSQLRAMLSITRASLRAIFRSPSAVAFSFIFPFIFIIVFGFIGGSGTAPTFKLHLAPGSDTTNALYDLLRNNSRIKWTQYEDTAALRKDLIRGRITGVLSIRKNASASPAYVYSLRTTTASNDKWPQFLPFIQDMVETLNKRLYPDRPSFASTDFNPMVHVEQVRKYQMIDFILPGQLGFSLLSAGVFGVAFMFFNLRSTLVLKRFFATPIQRTYIVLGEGLARVLFQLLTAVVIILAGYFFFGFTLIHSWITFLEMLFLSFLGLLVFMGMGFIVSGLAKNESTIPPFANLITLPQFLLGGTFFSVDLFPKWLQPISNALPLTHLNTALRSVAFEGQHLWDVREEIGILILSGIVVYAVAIKVFKWE